jgi:photoactive yellow protein
MVYFDALDLLDRLEGMSAAELDELDFGVVRMDPNGTVRAYNRSEAALSGMQPDAVIGKDFFVQVAPCTNNYMVAERYRHESALDESLDYVFTYMMVPTPVRLRLLKREGAIEQYLAVRVTGGARA